MFVIYFLVVFEEIDWFGEIKFEYFFDAKSVSQMSAKNGHLSVVEHELIQLIIILDLLDTPLEDLLDDAHYVADVVVEYGIEHVLVHHIHIADAQHLTIDVLLLCIFGTKCLPGSLNELHQEPSHDVEVLPNLTGCCLVFLRFGEQIPLSFGELIRPMCVCGTNQYLSNCFVSRRQFIL